MKTLIQLLVLFFAILSEIAALTIGKTVPISKQQPALLALRDMSAVIFAIMGAWIAVLHPQILKQLVKKDEKSSPDDLPRSLSD